MFWSDVGKGPRGHDTLVISNSTSNIGYKRKNISVSFVDVRVQSVHQYLVPESMYGQET